MIKRLSISAFLILVFLSACGIKSATPLAELQLDSLLIQPGDLPAGLTGAQIRDEAPAMFDDIPMPDKEVFQQFERDGEASGGVSVFLYEDENIKEQAYQEILSGMGSETKPISGIGEKASISTLSFLGIESADMVFTRCNSVVHIRIVGTSDEDAIKSYAKRLDARLKEIVCH